MRRNTIILILILLLIAAFTPLLTQQAVKPVQNIDYQADHPDTKSNQPSEAAESYQFNNATLSLGGDRVPGNLPERFRYPDGKIILTGISGADNFMTSTEGAMLIESNDPHAKVVEYYEQLFGQFNWQIIQSHRGDHETLLMAETTFKKLFTVIIRNEQPTSIRIYFKRSGSD